MNHALKAVFTSVVAMAAALLLTVSISSPVFGQKAPDVHGFAVATVTADLNGKPVKVKFVSQTFAYHPTQTNFLQLKQSLKTDLDQAVSAKFGKHLELSDFQVTTSFSMIEIARRHKLAWLDSGFERVAEFASPKADAVTGTFPCPVRD